MAVGKNIAFLANGFNLACALRSFSPTAEVESLDATTLCSSGYRSYVQGLKNGNLSAEGIWDYDTSLNNKIDDVFKAAFGDGREVVITASMEAITVGGWAVMMNATVQSYDVNVPLGQLIMTNASFQSKNAVLFGKWLFNQSVNNTTVNGTSVDNTASSSKGAVMHAHQQDTNSTSTSVTFQHSSNNSTWVDLGQITLTADNEAKSLEISGTINRYIRAVVAVSGGTTTVQAALARK